MKKSLLLAFLMANCIFLAAQVPEFFNYQAIVRNAAGQPVVSQTVSLWFTIYKTSPAGTNVYSEKHSPVTNEFGLVTLAIGNGTDKSGDFTIIDWGADSYFLNVKIDPSGGTTYTDMGTTQLLSVPYAMHAKTVENNDDADADPVNEIQDLTIDGFNLGITGGDGVTIPSLWKIDGQGIKYDGGKVLIDTKVGETQLELPDVFDAGGKNLIIGDDAYLTDIDQVNTLGIYGSIDSESGGIKLGKLGPTLSRSMLNPGGLIINDGGDFPIFGTIKLGDIGPAITSSLSEPGILKVQNGFDPTTGTIKLGEFGPIMSGNNENLSIDRNLNMNNLSIINVSDPVNSQDAATKAYVDELRSILFLVTDPSKLLTAGVSVADLLAAGVSVADLLAAGASVSDLFNEGIGVGTLEQNGASSQELTDAGLIGTLNDTDGKTYKWIKIGSQIWMGENLAYLPSVVGPGTVSSTTSYYYVYGYNGTDVNAAKATSNYTAYGVLYNWPAAMNGAASSSSNPSGVKGVCPTGWHLPSDAEWTTLENYLIANEYNYDGTTTENKIAKSLASTSGWTSSSNPGAVGNSDYPEKRNATSFTALPGGFLYLQGWFELVGERSYWWSTTEYQGTTVWTHNMAYNVDGEGKWNESKNFGFSVRCVKD